MMKKFIVVCLCICCLISVLGLRNNLTYNNIKLILDDIRVDSDVVLDDFNSFSLSVDIIKLQFFEPDVVNYTVAPGTYIDIDGNEFPVIEVFADDADDNMIYEQTYFFNNTASMRSVYSAVKPMVDAHNLFDGSNIFEDVLFVLAVIFALIVIILFLVIDIVEITIVFVIALLKLLGFLAV